MLLALGACSADGATSPTQSSNTPVPYGNYAISTVNGSPSTLTPRATATAGLT